MKIVKEQTLNMVKASTSLPVGAAFDYYSSYPEFMNRAGQASSRMKSLYALINLVISKSKRISLVFKFWIFTPRLPNSPYIECIKFSLI